MSAKPAARSGESPRGVRVPAPSAWWVLIAGAIGLLASMTLTAEKIHILLNPSYVPSCNLNPVLSCGSVMLTPQASLLGFPNALIGISGFTVIVVSGVLAVTKVPLPQWYWSGLAMATALGAGFVHWLIFQSLYRIGELCPYCMAVWAVTIPLLVVVASIALRPACAGGGTVAQTLYRWRWSITALWFTTVVLLILARFWDYWSTLL
ncbi:vitamin K epoxide reductase family protein [Mycobacterium sp. SM1]|uniref:vitamin K epoxide reductase family protein n=1 Tax=Mycobacterium sp. SM1 TaxID=2816243 RepID=UPI001BCC57C5|nr:vitamin K epoxide reductase family protein [Mycobacterium sp. SM1]MBS4726926.1 vitamin K epoxide reductase family protein [Mycobacterium sp. SM1]